MRAVIVDDEKSARESLISLLSSDFGEIEIVGEADGVSAGVQLVEATNPELIFLDVQMLDGNGFDLLSRIDRSNIYVIFISAYDRFAITAIKFSAVDYLLKPVDSFDLSLALKKLKSTSQSNELKDKLDLLLSNIHKIEKIALPSLNGVEFVRLENIIRCESDNNYTNFYLKSGEKIVVSKTLKEFSDILENKGFFRTHKSHIINMIYLKKYIKGDGGIAVLEDGSQIVVSRRNKERFREAFESFC